jgi:TPR repeat protein
MHAGAQKELVFALVNGNGTEVDETQSIELFRLSAALGHIGAINNFGISVLKRTDNQQFDFTIWASFCSKTVMT